MGKPPSWKGPRQREFPEGSTFKASGSDKTTMTTHPESPVLSKTHRCYRDVAQSAGPGVGYKEGDLGRCGTPTWVQTQHCHPHGGNKLREQGSRHSSLHPSQSGPHPVSQEEGKVT